MVSSQQFQFADHYRWGQITELANGLLFDWVNKKQNIVFAGGLVDPLSSYSFSIIKAMSVMCVSSGELGKINAVLSALESLFPLVAVQGYTSIWKVISKVSCFLIRILLILARIWQKFKNVESDRKNSWFFIDVDIRDFKMRLFQKSEANFSEVPYLEISLTGLKLKPFDFLQAFQKRNRIYIPLHTFQPIKIQCSS